MKPVVLIDLDGTLCDHAFPEIGPIKPGVKKALQEIRDLGFEIHICSCRTNHEVSISIIERLEQIKKMKKFLDDNEIPYNKILNNDKPVAYAYIDDRGIGFRDNWENTIKELKKIIKRDKK